MPSRGSSRGSMDNACFARALSADPVASKRGGDDPGHNAQGMIAND
jgi:hypothetical protein